MVQENVCGRQEMGVGDFRVPFWSYSREQNLKKSKTAVEDGWAVGQIDGGGMEWRAERMKDYQLSVQTPAEYVIGGEEKAQPFASFKSA